MKYLYILLIIILSSCTKIRIDINNDRLIGNWKNNNIILTLTKDSFNLNSELNNLYGRYNTAENTLICKTQNNEYLHIIINQLNDNELNITYFIEYNKQYNTTLIKQ